MEFRSIFFTIFMLLNFGLSQGAVNDSIFTKSFTAANDSKQSFQYDTQGRSLGSISYLYDEDAQKWIGSSKVEYSYVLDTTTTSSYSWNIKSSIWELKAKSKYVSTKVSENCSEGRTWSFENNTWKLSSGSKSEFALSSSGKISWMISYALNLETLNWIESWKFTYTYDNQDNTIGLVLYQWDSTQNSWNEYVNYQYQNTYNASNQLLASILEYRHGGSGDWAYSSKTENFWTSNHITASVLSMWNPPTSAWIPYTRTETVYDGLGNIATTKNYSIQNAVLHLNSMTTNFIHGVNQQIVLIAPHSSSIRASASIQYSVTEKPTATYREWLFRKVGDALFTSFSPKELGTTLVMPPSQAGEYELICRSTLDGIEVVSDTALLFVKDVRISPITIQQINRNAYGSALWVTENPKVKSRTWKYSETAGGPYISMYEYGGTYSPQFTKAGSYFVICNSIFDSINVNSNEVNVQVSGVNISPLKAQYISAGKSAITLTANEYPAATSREWKYKTVAAPQWVSFDQPKTASTYTPTFKASGVYFIACFSRISGMLYMSDSIEIHVESVNQVTPSATQTLAVNNLGVKLKAVISEPVTQYWGVTTTSGGPYSYLASSDTLTPKFAKPGIYYLTNMGNFEDSLITSNEVKIIILGNQISPIDSQSIAPGDSGKQLSILENGVASEREWKYKLVGASAWTSFPTVQALKVLTPKDLLIGNYYVACFSTINGITYESNSIRMRIVTGNSITPSQSQSINRNTNGTLLSVTESPAANSRYWYYSNSPDTGFINTYSSGTTYTPKFAKSGLYYIVCKSTWDSKVLTSNPVSVTVIGNTSILTSSISPSTETTVSINTAGTALAVSESVVADSREWLYAKSPNGDFITLFSSASAYTPTFKDIGIIYVICRSVYDNQVSSSNAVKINVVGNLIAPTYANVVASRTSNTAIVVQESSKASSRKWMYKTSLNGAWIDFTTAETEVAFYPKFSAAGTYWVSCLSTINGIQYQSNSTKIDVSTNTIAPVLTQNILTNVNGSTLTNTELIAADSHNWLVSRISGSDYVEYVGNGTSYTPKFVLPGIYYVVCKSRWGSDERLSNEVVINVTGSSILPKQPQLINTNVEGNVLTVSEYPAATSREWKYRSGSTGAWLSFATPKTNSTLIPIFAMAGKYEITCFSMISGVQRQSDSISIVVATSTISPVSDQSINVSELGTLLTSIESLASDSRAWYFSTSSGGPYTSFLASGSSFQPEFINRGLYYVVCRSVWGSNVGYSNEVRIYVSGVNISPVTPQILVAKTPGTNVKASEFPAATSREWMYRQNSSSSWSSFSPTETALSSNPKFQNTGSYEVACFSNIGGRTYQSEVVPISVVSNSITPAENQVLKITEAGSLLSVTESKAADSRIWQYAKTTGGPYSGVLSTELSFTPEFVEPGIYYVVCNSKWGSTIGSSNEVIIIAANVTISPSVTQNISEGVQGTLVSVNEDPVAASREWMYRSSPTGIWLSFLSIESNTTYYPLFNSAGSYDIACFSKIEDRIFESNSISIVVSKNSSSSHSSSSTTTSSSSGVVATTITANSKLFNEGDKYLIFDLLGRPLGEYPSFPVRLPINIYIVKAYTKQGSMIGSRIWSPK